MNAETGPYQGQDRFECRRNLVRDLEERGLLEKVEAYRHGVGHCYRCQTVVEPNLSKQWFVKIQPLADKAIHAVESGRTRIVPKNWEKTYFDWMYNIRDWCVSRQLWWGHRIPAYYCRDCGHLTVARQDPEACPECGGPVVQDPDVLDTWFSSALWPFSTLGWPDDTQDQKTYYPTSLLVTGFDILFFWVARMMMMGLQFKDETPFDDVYIHALVRDKDGQKMSKSKGNVIDPLEVMDRFGTDALRLTLTALAAQGRDVRLSDDRIEGYGKFINKLWNAARFTLMNLEGFGPGADEKDGYRLTQEPSLADAWILSRLSRVAEGTARHLDGYHFDRAAGDLYQFVWHEFCDWYLELIKPVMYEGSPEAKRQTQSVLHHALSVILRLLHPVIPFVTEEIWRKLPGERESIMIAPFPAADCGRPDPGAETRMKTLMAVITAVRNIRGEMNVPPSLRVETVMMAEDNGQKEVIEAHREYITTLTRSKSLDLVGPGQKPKGAAAQVADGVEVFVVLTGIIDFAEERKRLTKELAKVDQDMDRANKKLANPGFVQKAPEDVVQRERDRVEELSVRREKLDHNLSRIEELMEAGA
jgi:valyl-tRNA synthetase